MTAYPLMIYAAMALVLAGLFFKISVVPFHMWTPDVYDGAPTPVTAFMSVTIKAAGVLALYRIIFTAFPAISYRLSDLMMVLAIVTMTIGNLAALKQNGLKRMLAYSTIAHVGYILVGFTAALAATNDYSVDTFGAGSAIFFYLATYTFMNLGAFAIVLLFEKDADTPLLVDDMAGIGKHFPLLTAAFAVFLLSLAGIPPFSGFMGKFSLFFSAAKAGFFWLVLAGVINSLISVYYYLRVIVVMYTGKKAETGEIQITVPHLVVLFFTVAATIWLGIFPGTLLSIFKMAIAASF
jgi:NADH-quinone oxidoreductase subunit N